MISVSKYTYFESINMKAISKYFKNNMVKVTVGKKNRFDIIAFQD